MKKIGPYQVLGLLGKGGMARVYKVRRPSSQAILALKLLAPDPHLLSLLGEEETRNRFIAEAEIMAKLAHPHIVQCRDYDEYEGNPYIVMDYYCLSLGQVIGETYRYENPSRPMRVEKAVRFARETLFGLSRLHQAGIVHRDIKPFNLLLDKNETVKITDFGLSKLRGEVFPGPPQLIVGSPYYTAPEQERDPDRAAPGSDIYSLGVMLYRMLTGWLPLDEQERIILPSRRNPELNSDWDDFLLKAMAPEKNHRFQSADEMLGKLNLLNIRWGDRVSAYCRWFQGSAPPAGEKNKGPVNLRAKALKIRPGEARQEFGIDLLWRPQRYCASDLRHNDNDTVTDATTGLTWQRSGSRSAITWPEAHSYIETLNRKSYGGLNNWRLPTVPELMSILTPPGKDDYCIEAIFDRSRRWLWSTDRSSFVAAWYVSVTQGYVDRQDFTCRFFVRAVSSGSRHSLRNARSGDSQ